MPWLLLNTYIISCKLMVCIAVFVAVNSHHWVKNVDETSHHGLLVHCHDYQSECYKYNDRAKFVWPVCIVVLLNLLFEILNILLLWKRPRSRINLILEELSLVTTLIFLVPTCLFGIGMIVVVHHPTRKLLDWSFFIFLLSIVIAFIDFICSTVRVASYCRENSFRSNVITYSSNQNRERVHIQSA